MKKLLSVFLTILTLIPTIVTASKTVYFFGDYYEEDGAPFKYYSSPSGRIMRKDGEVYYIITDHLGSTTIVTDSSGNKVGEMDYYPYGVTYSSEGNIASERKYTGQILDNSIELYFYNARYYNPQIGRFLSADVAGDGYTYAGNNPVMFSDPSGNMVVSGGGVESLDLPYGYGPIYASGLAGSMSSGDPMQQYYEGLTVREQRQYNRDAKMMLKTTGVVYTAVLGGAMLGSTGMGLKELFWGSFNWLAVDPAARGLAVFSGGAGIIELGVAGNELIEGNFGEAAFHAATAFTFFTSADILSRNYLPFGGERTEYDTISTRTNRGGDVRFHIRAEGITDEAGNPLQPGDLSGMTEAGQQYAEKLRADLSLVRTQNPGSNIQLDTAMLGNVKEFLGLESQTISDPIHYAYLQVGQAVERSRYQGRLVFPWQVPPSRSYHP